MRWTTKLQVCQSVKRLSADVKYTVHTHKAKRPQISGFFPPCVVRVFAFTITLCNTHAPP